MATTLNIHPEFARLLPPLSADELAALRASIQAEGCRDAIITWRGFIVDGHNRYAICTDLGVPFEVVERDFADADTVMDWIDANQIARRNLTPDDFRLAVGRRYNRTKLTMAEAGAVRLASDNLAEAHTAERIASESGVSERTVRRAGQFAEAVEDVQREEPEVVAQGREAVFERAKEKARPHVANNAGDHEWYTPREYIALARQVMGAIDLDPASSAEANAVVGALRFYSASDNGLDQPWFGAVYLNPPYASDLVGPFIEKLAASVEAGQVTQCIVLVNNATETRWFARLASLAGTYAAVLCLPSSRVKFWKPDGTIAAPLQGQAIVYAGPHSERFVAAFSEVGIIARIVERRP